MEHDRLAVRHRERRHRPPHARAALSLQPLEALARELLRVLDERHDVATLQHPSFDSAEAARQIGTTTAEHLGHRDAARDREIGARAARRAADREARAARHQDRAVERHVGLEVGADERHQRVAIELQVGTEHGDLERRDPRLVADQRIGERERDRIHRATGAETHVLMAVPAHVLHRHQEARAQDVERHLRYFWNSARVIGLK